MFLFNDSLFSTGLVGAGSGATGAFNSNFFGEYAGYSATNADNSNFLGLNAGYQATNANSSNFLGDNAGFQATNAYYSNFLGTQAGYTATNVIYSNFLGVGAGRAATNARNSNFLGQYAGYLNENNIPSDSTTETFVFFKAYVNTPRFKGVPFYLMSGKKLDKKESLIEIEFEETSEQRKWNLPLSTNKLFIKIAPEDGMGLVLNSKVPGLRDDVEPVELEYCVACNEFGNLTEAYEKLIIDIVGQHKTLLTRWDEIELSWHFIDHIKKYQKDLVIYKDYNELKKLIKELTNEEMK